VSGLRGVVVCHGELATALVHSAEEITGVRDILIPISNTGCSRDQLEERIVSAVGDQPSVIFVDMPSGSCLFAAARRLGRLGGTRMVTGVNLAMLLDFLFHHGLTPDEAARRAIEIGGKAITVR
jgi:mannose/fructose-specific phosphotransferase system component IIA